MQGSNFGGQTAGGYQQPGQQQMIYQQQPQMIYQSQQPQQMIYQPEQQYHGQQQFIVVEQQPMLITDPNVKQHQGQTVQLYQNNGFQAGVPQGVPGDMYGGQMMMQQQQRQQLPSHANGMEYPARIKCPHCQKECTTLVNSKSGGTVCAWVLITCFFCFPFCCIPCCVDSCKDKEHKCPNCQAVVGIQTKSLC